jgi:hypothetical protein
MRRHRDVRRIGAGVAGTLLAIAPPGAIPHPDTATAVVLRVTTVAPPGHRRGPMVSIRGDGSVVLQPALRGAGHPSPEPLVFKISERGIQRVLRSARAAGLLGDTRYGRTRVTDHRVTVIEVTAAGRHRVVRVEGLALFAFDSGVTGPERAARRALHAFVRRVTAPAFYVDVLPSR